MDRYEAFEKYSHYEEMFDPMETDRQARRRRNPKPAHTPKVEEEEVREALADEMLGMEGGFETTYQPAKHEKQWLTDSLRGFFEQSLITDVLAQVKGGKEASVYRCAAHPSTGVELLAAKVFRPRMFRQLRNDKLYRQGRGVLDADGHDVMGGLHKDRIMRALGKKTDFGVQVAHTSWLMHEFTALETLYNAGAEVPRPVRAGSNALLMSYHGNSSVAAPTLHTVSLSPGEAGALLADVLRTVEIMLANGIVHGDLSAYNILYWEGAITVIDFPQVVDIHSNPDAAYILHRDLTRVCEYFTRQGAPCDADETFRRLWGTYHHRNPEHVLADLSRRWAEEE